ncbi:MAG: hypothetical protein ACKO4Z_08895 [Planctomycetota bacterium]
MRTFSVVAFVDVVLAAVVARAQTTSGTYAGNGNTSFGGAVGNGSLEVTNDASGALNFTYTRGSSNFNNAIVIYIDSGTGGATTTSGFTDTADGLRRAISGLDGSNRSALNFAAGFGADYAVALNDGFAGLWSLSNPANFPFVASANLSPTGQTNATYAFGITAGNIGLTPNSGQSFSLFTSYISETAFRSVETFGASFTGSPSAGWNTFDAASSNSFVLVPEPSSAVICGAACLGLATRSLLRSRRRGG